MKVDLGQLDQFLLTASAISHIACFICLFDVILVKHKCGFHILCKNINTVAMLTHEVLLHHSRNGCSTEGYIGGCALSSLVSWYYIYKCTINILHKTFMKVEILMNEHVYSIPKILCILLI